LTKELRTDGLKSGDLHTGAVRHPECDNRRLHAASNHAASETSVETVGLEPLTTETLPLFTRRRHRCGDFVDSSISRNGAYFSRSDRHDDSPFRL